MGKCDGYRDQVSAYLDGVLSEEERRELMEHLAVCESCQAYFDDQLAMQAALSQLEVPVPEGFTARVMERVRAEMEEAPESGEKMIRFPGWRRLAALAACCAVVCLGVWGSGVLKGQSGTDFAAEQQAAVEIAEDSAQAHAADPADGQVRAYRIEPEEADAEAPMSASPGPEAAAAAPPAQSSAAAMDSASPAAGVRQATAEKQQGIAWTLTAAGPTAQAWVESELGRSWALGTVYSLTEEQYTALASLLAEAGEDFAEASGAAEEGWRLLAGEPS